MDPIIVRELKVVVMSREFADLAKEVPEIQNTQSVEYCGKHLDGPRTLLVVSSINEIKDGFDRIMEEARKAFADPCVRLLFRTGRCYKCTDPNVSCTHWSEIAALCRFFELRTKEDAERITQVLSNLPSAFV